MRNVLINIQPIEKRALSNGQILDVHSIFYTIQGEGPFTGVPAVFVRLAGCNLQCPSCDTQYTVGRKEMTVDQILEECFILTAYRAADLVVITGGEPFRQSISLLLRNLNVEGFRVQIETNGTLELPELFKATVVCSPKAGKVHSSVLRAVDHWKYVLDHKSMDPADGLPILALNHRASPKVQRPPRFSFVYLQPMDTQDEKENKLNLDAVVKSCMEFGYTLQLQTHKIIGLA